MGTIIWGDDPSAIDMERKGCRILCQNVNGLHKGESYAKANEIGEAATELGINILGLNETNVDWKKGNTQTAVRSIFRRFWKNTKMCFSSSDHEVEREYQPGELH